VSGGAVVGWGQAIANILLVEDDGELLPLIEDILVSGDHRVATAVNAATAVALLRARPFDLVISDIVLPDGNGLAIGDLAHGLGVKVLLMTGYGLRLEPGRVERYNCLLKPIRPAAILIAVEQRLADA
jgi:DNA-binding NtrC family response regulator